MDVVVAVLLDLQQQSDLRQALGGERFQQKAVLLRRRRWGHTQNPQKKMTRARKRYRVAHFDPALKRNEGHANGILPIILAKDMSSIVPPPL